MGMRWHNSNTTIDFLQRKLLHLCSPIARVKFQRVNLLPQTSNLLHYDFDAQVWVIVWADGNKVELRTEISSLQISRKKSFRPKRCQIKNLILNIPPRSKHRPMKSPQDNYILNSRDHFKSGRWSSQRSTTQRHQLNDVAVINNLF
jgi:hypothetical protein